jgi:uncharacterized repeat protein (TIGR03803 family)
MHSRTFPLAQDEQITNVEAFAPKSPRRNCATLLPRSHFMNSLFRKIRIGSRAVAFALTLLAVFAGVAIPAHAQTVTTLYNFGQANGDPTFPTGTMAQGRDGEFYGITQAGNGCCQGIVYKISSAGAITPLYSTVQSDGINCNGLVLATDGNFYGTCKQGGLNNGNPGGTFIRVTPDGTLTVLHNFVMIGQTTDGCYPAGTPVQGSDGNFYGTTYSCGANNIGMVYKITLAGVYTQLYSFKGGSSDVGAPYGLVQGSDGNFWGMSGGEFAGGANGNGGVFKISSKGKEKLVYSFKGAPNDGGTAQTSLIQASDGNYYGSTLLGGSSGNSGVLFKLTPGGKETVLYNFGVPAQGGSPQLPMTEGPDGLLYGIATGCSGGGCGQAAIFDISLKGAYNTLYLYPNLGGNNNSVPLSPLLLSTDGTFYSTTEQGTTARLQGGTFYSLSTTFSPFISLVNVTSGKEGTQVGILGQGFTGSSVVKFGGTAATATQLTGSTFILATVPAGALTGKVTVTTGSTTLSTNSTYKVTPTVSGFTPPNGPVGTSVTINGTGLAQATKVTFNKVAATFTVNSDSKITATVPAGATTGKIAVTTKGGSVTGSKNFTVN